MLGKFFSSFWALRRSKSAYYQDTSASPETPTRQNVVLNAQQHSVIEDGQHTLCCTSRKSVQQSPCLHAALDSKKSRLLDKDNRHAANDSRSWKRPALQRSSFPLETAVATESDGVRSGNLSISPAHHGVPLCPTFEPPSASPSSNVILEPLELLRQEKRTSAEYRELGSLPFSFESEVLRDKQRSLINGSSLSGVKVLRSGASAYAGSSGAWDTVEVAFLSLVSQVRDAQSEEDYLRISQFVDQLSKAEYPIRMAIAELLYVDHDLRRYFSNVIQNTAAEFLDLLNLQCASYGHPDKSSYNSAVAGCPFIKHDKTPQRVGTRLVAASAGATFCQSHARSSFLQGRSATSRSKCIPQPKTSRGVSLLSNFSNNNVCGTTESLSGQTPAAADCCNEPAAVSHQSIAYTDLTESKPFAVVSASVLKKSNKCLSHDKTNDATALLETPQKLERFSVSCGSPRATCDVTQRTPSSQMWEDLCSSVTLPGQYWCTLAYLKTVGVLLAETSVDLAVGFSCRRSFTQALANVLMEGMAFHSAVYFSERARYGVCSFCPDSTASLYPPKPASCRGPSVFSLEKDVAFRLAQHTPSRVKVDLHSKDRMDSFRKMSHALGPPTHQTACSAAAPTTLLPGRNNRVNSASDSTAQPDELFVVSPTSIVQDGSLITNCFQLDQRTTVLGDAVAHRSLVGNTGSCSGRRSTLKGKKSFFSGYDPQHHSPTLSSKPNADALELRHAAVPNVSQYPSPRRIQTLSDAKVYDELSSPVQPLFSLPCCSVQPLVRSLMSDEEAVLKTGFQGKTLLSRTRDPDAEAQADAAQLSTEIFPHEAQPVACSDYLFSTNSMHTAQAEPNAQEDRAGKTIGSAQTLRSLEIAAMDDQPSKKSFPLPDFSNREPLSALSSVPSFIFSVSRSCARSTRLDVMNEFPRHMERFIFGSLLVDIGQVPDITKKLLLIFEYFAEAEECLPFLLDSGVTLLHAVAHCQSVFTVVANSVALCSAFLRVLERLTAIAILAIKLEDASRARRGKRLSATSKHRNGFPAAYYSDDSAVERNKTHHVFRRLYNKCFPRVSSVGKELDSKNAVSPTQRSNWKPFSRLRVLLRLRGRDRAVGTQDPHFRNNVLKQTDVKYTTLSNRNKSRRYSYVHRRRKQDCTMLFPTLTSLRLSSSVFVVPSSRRVGGGEEKVSAFEICNELRELAATVLPRLACSCRYHDFHVSETHSRPSHIGIPIEALVMSSKSGHRERLVRGLLSTCNFPALVALREANEQVRTIVQALNTTAYVCVTTKSGELTSSRAAAGESVLNTLALASKTTKPNAHAKGVLLNPSSVVRRNYFTHASDSPASLPVYSSLDLLLVLENLGLLAMSNGTAVPQSSSHVAANFVAFCRCAHCGHLCTAHETFFDLSFKRSYKASAVGSYARKGFRKQRNGVARPYIVCTECQMTRYCSQECQKKDYGMHAKFCELIRGGHRL